MAIISSNRCSLAHFRCLSYNENLLELKTGENIVYNLNDFIKKRTKNPKFLMSGAVQISECPG